jgi:hypothetical protein
MLATTFLTTSKMTVSDSLMLIAVIGEVNIEYLRINIEDNSSVPIKLSFPVAYQFLENAFNECKLLTRDKTKRNNALVDDSVLSQSEIRDQALAKLNQTALLCSLDVDFKANNTKKTFKKEEVAAHKID